MALTKEDLQAIGALMDSKLEPINTRLDKVDSRLDKVDSRLDKVDSQLDIIQEDLETIKEESTITRSMTNRLLKWAEKADRTAVNVGFDETE